MSGWDAAVAAGTCLFPFHARVTSVSGLAFQERPWRVPCDAPALPAGNIPVGVYGPGRRRAVPGAAVSGE